MSPHPATTRFAIVVILALVGQATLPPFAADAQDRAGAAGASVVPTTVQAIVTSPTFYHLKTVLVRGTVVVQDGVARLSTDEAPRSVVVVGMDAVWPDGPVEIRGQVWDIGRLGRDDPRFAGFDVKSLVERHAAGRWPAPGEMLAIRAVSLEPAAVLPATTLSAIVLEPSKYEGGRVTLTGQFGGRNLYGDLPQALGRDRWDFVLRSGGAALWVSGMRPRGKGFDLDAGRRVDTGTWLTVTGTVRRRDAMTWIEATRLQKAARPEEPIPGPMAPPAGPPPEVRFSVPAEGETDVAVSTRVRIQFTRDLDAATLADRTRVTYAVATGEAPGPPVAHAVSWDAGSRVLTITFAGPLDRFRTVRVELLDGIRGTDGQLLKSWVLTFTTG